jgi:murein DD-endopeptidase MepM/ murein hydrolase activator NlpD
MQDSSIGGLVQVPAEMLTGSGNGLERKIQAAQNSTGEKKKEELKKVAQEFEAVFIANLLKVMRETIEESGLMEEGFGKSIYTEMFDQEVSLSMARRGALGISNMLYQNLSAAEESKDLKESSQTPAEKQVVEQPNATASPETSSEKKDEQEISDMQLPIRAPISSGFGLRVDPFSHKTHLHKGVDFAAPEGTKILAALPGTVVSAGYENGYGNSILIKHVGGLQTRYGHLGSINVKAGDNVSSDQVLGTVGDTGRSTGPHLHFEVIRMGKAVNPLGRMADLENRNAMSKRL